MKKQEKFIPGIYNYCDRWCEKCRLTHKCFLFEKDQKRLKKHREKREAPYDLKIVMKDVKEIFKETMKLIKKAAKEQGIDLEKLPDEKYEPPDPSNHPLCKASRRYMKLANKFLKNLRKLIGAEGFDLTKRIEIMPEPEKDIKNLREIVSCYEVISWYHTLISAKIYRALCKEEDEELAKIEKYDSDGSAKVAYMGLVESINALQKVYEWDEEMQDGALTLLVEADRLRRAIDREFPGHKKFKRPGFDDRKEK